MQNKIGESTTQTFSQLSVYRVLSETVVPGEWYNLSVPSILSVHRLDTGALDLKKQVKSINSVNQFIINC